MLQIMRIFATNVDQTETGELGGLSRGKKRKLGGHGRTG